MNINEHTDCGYIQRTWAYIIDRSEISKQIKHNSSVYECRLIHNQITPEMYIRTALDTSMNIAIRKKENDKNRRQIENERISFLRENISHFEEFGVFPPNE